MKVLNWIKTKKDRLLSERLDDNKLTFLLSLEIASFIVLSYGLVKVA
jgi:hypothetical protein